MSFKPTINLALQWALTATQPAGPDPWSGQPTKVLPPGDYFPANTKPPAEYFNYILADDSRRLAEARADLIAIQRWGEVGASSHLSVVAEDARGMTVTPKGRVYRSAAYGSLSDYARVMADGRLVRWSSTPMVAGNLLPAGVCASGEKVLFCDSPSSYIYDAEAKTFSAAITFPSSARAIEAIPTATGWTVLVAESLSFAGAVAGANGARTYPAKPAVLLECYTVSFTGVIGSASGSSALNNSMSSFNLNDAMKVHWLRCASDSDIFLLLSGEIGQQRRAVYSTDGGSSWTVSTLPNPYPADDDIWTCEYDTITARLVLAVSQGTRCFVYTSVDMGANWVQLGAEFITVSGSEVGGDFCPTDIRRSAAGLLFATGYVRADMFASNYIPIHVSSDGGTTWKLAYSIGDASLGRAAMLGTDMPFQAFAYRGAAALYPKGGPLLSYGDMR